jgi:hypothetical protein
MIQSVDYKTPQDFFNDIKPPFFDDYTIVLVDGIEDCYNIAMKLTGVLVVSAASFITFV